MYGVGKKDYRGRPMSFNKDLQELLNSTLQGAKLRGETETATKLTRAIKMLEEDNAKKSQDFREGAAKASETKRLKTQETVRAFKLSLPPQEQNKPVTSALARPIHNLSRQVQRAPKLNYRPAHRQKTFR